MRGRVGMLQSVFLLSPEDNLRGFHTAGTGHFTTLALAAKQHPFINGFLPLATESLSVGSRLFGARESRVDPEHGAVFHADCAAYAVLEFHRIHSRHDLAAACPVASAKPCPQPFFSVSVCARMAPHAKTLSHGQSTGRKSESTATPACPMPWLKEK